MRKGIVAQMLDRPQALAVAWSAFQVFGSRIAGQAAGVLMTIVCAKYLGPEAFGLYSFALVLTILLSQVPGPGLDMSAIRLSVRDWVSEPRRARGVLFVAGMIKLIATGAVALLGLVLTAPSIWSLFADVELAMPMRYAVFSAVGLAMTEFMVAALQARERFGQILNVSLLVAGLKLLPVLVLASVAMLSLGNALVAFLAATYLGAGASLIAARGIWSGERQWDRQTIQELFVYGRWIIANTLLGALTVALDMLMLTWLAGPEVAGIYSAGRTLALPLAIIGGAVGAVLLPKLSRMSVVQARGYVRDVSLLVAAGAAVLGIAIVAVAPLLIQVVYGDHYAEAVPIFQLLALAYLAQMVTWPFLTVLMVFNRPQILVLLSLVMLAICVPGYAWALPLFGAVGVAAVYCFGCAVLIAPYVVLARRLLVQEARG